MGNGAQNQTIDAERAQGLLELFSEPCAFFDRSWRFLGASGAFFDLFGYPRGDVTLRGRSACDLFFDRNLARHEKTPPVLTTGEQCLVMACLADGSLTPLIVRCMPVPEGGFLATCADAEQVSGNKYEQIRLLDELRTSNRRLRGILSIISTTTLDITSFGDFTGKVTNALREVFDADAVLLYLAEERGFRLRGASDGYDLLGIDQTFAPAGTGITSLVARERRSMRLQLAQGTANESGVVMVDPDTDRRFRLRTPLARRCQTIVATPVYSYDRVMAVIFVCWRTHHVVDAGSLPMLDTVADFLSVEFATSVSQYQQARRMEFTQLLNDVRDAVRSRGHMSDRFAVELASRIVDVVPAHVIEMVDNPWTLAVTARPLDEMFLRADPQLPDGEPEQEKGASAGASTEATESTAASDETGLSVAYRDGIGMPFTFEDIFPGDTTSRTVVPNDSVGEWVGRHSDLRSGLALRMTPQVTLGETPQFGLLLMRGNADPPFDDDEVAFVRRLGEVLITSLNDERERINDTHIAQALQSGMRNKLPQAPGVSTASLYLSATASAVVGGDFFDLYTLPDERVMVLIGDVSGKGVEAAAMASLVKTAVAAYAWDGLAPAQIASSVNTLVSNFSRAENFASLIVVLVDVHARHATYCSAGHPPAMLVHHPHGASPELELLTCQSPVIGAMQDMTYEDGSFDYEIGDLLFLYTDGTTEARSPSGEFFGQDTLRETLLRCCRLDLQQVPEAVLGYVASFAQGNLHDDIAMVAVRFEDVNESSS